jgi:hypothetical protein
VTGDFSFQLHAVEENFEAYHTRLEDGKPMLKHGEVLLPFFLHVLPANLFVFLVVTY